MVFFCFTDFALKGHVLPLFGPSLFIVKWLCFKLKNRAFRVIQHYEHHIYSESSHQEQSFKNIKMICHVSISKINFIQNLYLFLSKSPVWYRFFRKCTLVCLYTKTISIFFTKWQPSHTFGYMQQTQRKKIIYKHFRNLNSI